MGKQTDNSFKCSKKKANKKAVWILKQLLTQVYWQQVDVPKIRLLEMSSETKLAFWRCRATMN